MSDVKKRRLLVWGVVGLAGLALLISAMAPRPVRVDLAVVARGPLRVTVAHEGITRVRDRYVVSAPVAGRILRIELEPGDAVVAGESVLVTFLPSEPVLLDARARAEAQARVEAARAGLERASAERERARTTARFAASEHARLVGLQGEGIVSGQALEAAEADAGVAAEALEAAESAVEAARHELEAAAATLLEPGDAGAGQRAIRLRSPVSGVVLRRLRESESVVPVGEPLIEVADPSELEVIADYLSTDAVAMRTGMQVLIDRWGGDRVLAGRVRRIEPGGFLKVSALGVEEQRVWVVVDFNDPRAAWEALGDGYRVECRVVTWEGGDVLTVPTSALFRSGDGWAVFAVEGGRARLRAVEIGHRNGRGAELLGGLEAGDRVVDYPSDDVAGGVRVAVR